ncbi:endonuclease V [bacterium]|nr:endonuclease V [bacterium]
MKPADLPWPSDIKEAVSLQKELSEQLIIKGIVENPDLVAGVDCSSYGSSGIIVGAVAVWSLIKGELIGSTTAQVEAKFPYIPGLLAFREIPALLKAFEKLDLEPEVIICDGQGTAHMRGFGIACHLGLYIGIPTVGCGKSRLVGSFSIPENDKGSVSTLKYKGKEVGRVVRTRTGVKPVFVSPGHLIGIDEAVDIVLKSCTKYRLPEPIRAAHRLAGETMEKLHS